jgi:hypothetical protein
VRDGGEKWKPHTLGYAQSVVIARAHDDETDGARHAPEEGRGAEDGLQLGGARARDETQPVK